MNSLPNQCQNPRGYEDDVLSFAVCFAGGRPGGASPPRFLPLGRAAFWNRWNGMVTVDIVIYH